MICCLSSTRAWAPLGESVPFRSRYKPLSRSMHLQGSSLQGNVAAVSLQARLTCDAAGRKQAVGNAQHASWYISFQVCPCLTCRLMRVHTDYCCHQGIGEPTGPDCHCCEGTVTSFPRAFTALETACGIGKPCVLSLGQTATSQRGQVFLDQLHRVLLSGTGPLRALRKAAGCHAASIEMYCNIC